MKKDLDMKLCSLHNAHLLASKVYSKHGIVEDESFFLRNLYILNRCSLYYKMTPVKFNIYLMLTEKSWIFLSEKYVKYF